MTGPMISQAGVYDLDDDTYHRDPVQGGSLSSTGAKKLLPPSTPAHYRYWVDHGGEHVAAFDFGQAAHAKVLGVGREIVAVEAKDWKTKAAREERDAAYATGQIPLLAHEAEQVDAMAAAIREHPLAAALLNPDGAYVEHALIWQDPDAGIWRRSKLDMLRYLADGRTAIIDYKTTVGAAPSELGRTMHRYGYHQQAAYYLDGVRAVELGDDQAVFLFVFQEKTPPYLVSVAQCDQDALAWGERLNRVAIDTYRRCTETGLWPGYGDQPHQIELPGYALRAYEDADARGAHTIPDEPRSAA
jgi:hypothetical protein